MKISVDSSFFIGLFEEDEGTANIKKTFYALKDKREKVFVPINTISELVEILEKKYQLKREQVYNYIIAILSNYVFYVENADYFYRVIEQYRKYPNISLKKILIAEDSKSRKISKILAMDNSYDLLDLSTIKKINGG